MMARRRNDLVDVLRTVPLFSMIGEDDLRIMADQVRELNVGRGEILFQKGDQPHGFYVLLEGRITLAFPSEQGAERILEVIKPGETFGEALMFLGRPYPIFSHAGADSRVLDIPEQAINGLLDKDSQLARRMLAGISIRLHELISNLEACSMRSSAQRVACMLQHAAPASGMQEYEVRLQAAKHVVASQLNLTPETFSRVLHGLSESGLIEVSGRIIRVLDAEGLRKVQL
jgi:CRP/FNR family transcriptional regulator, dissimilatory nitrate respiration regulator